MPTPTPEHGYDGFWWRCEIRSYCVTDEWGDVVGSSATVDWVQFAVIRIMPKTVELIQLYGQPQDPDYYLERKGFISSFHQPIRVLGKAIRQHAAPTKELAWADAIERKKRHIRGCQARLHSAERDLKALNFHKPNTQF